MKKNFTHGYVKSTSINEENFTMTFVMSAEIIDRHGEVVDIDSVNVEKFMLNPVFIPAHNHNEKSIGQVVKMWVEEQDSIKKLMGEVKFAVKEYDLAKTYWELYKGGYMRAVSISFIPESVQIDGEVRRLMGAELIELSAVAVPANFLSVAKQKGLQINPLLTEILISTKNLIEEYNEKKEEEPETKEPETTKKEAPKITQAQLKKIRTRKLLNQAIREMKKGR